MSPGALPERVVISVGASSLVSEGRPDPAKLSALADAVVRMRADGVQPVLIGTGAVDVGAAWLASAGIPHSPTARQLAAAVGQGLLFESLRAALAERGLIAAQILLTPVDLTGTEHRDSSRKLLEDTLDAGLVPVVHENDAVMVRNSDVLAALLAASLQAARLLLFSDVPVLQDRGPGRGHRTRRTPEVAVIPPEIGQLVGIEAHGLGAGGAAAVLCAAWMATLAGVPVVIADADCVVLAARGEDFGTLVHPRDARNDLDLARLWRSLTTPPATASAPNAGTDLLTPRDPSRTGGSHLKAINGDWRIITRPRRPLTPLTPAVEQVAS
ncbi:hypothetical protein ACFXB3_13220 [Streptomyces sp. NPDC059447]|uniref:amino acid kinase family protein n=1 Tax=Streptomyces sp. NPDC059447 TaxID=3346834 RepID=UPI0036900592